MAARYNKVPRDLWHRGDVIGLGKIPYSDGSLYLYLLTADRPSCVAGMLHAGAGSVADDTGWDHASVGAGLDRLHASGLIVRSKRPAHVWVPACLECEDPAGAKQVKGWESALTSMQPSEALTACWNVVFAGRDTPWDTLSDTPSYTPSAFDRTQEQEQEQKNNPPTPRKRGASKRPTHDESPEAMEVYGFWKALQAERGTVRTGKAFPAGWQVQARINEFGVPTVKAVIEWAHKADHKLAANLRDGDYLTDTLFRPGNFPKYEGPAVAWKAGTPTQDKAAWLADWRESLDAFDSACRFNGFERSTDGFHAFISKHRKQALPIPADVTALVGRRIERNA